MPIKRNESLKAISREHHHGLLLCWKIRTGIKRQIEPERIKKYSDWFYTSQLLPHFELEEQHIFTLLGNENELVKKALSEHRRLKRLFESETEVMKNLTLIEEELESHIRFEERVLFNEIQLIATEEQLQEIKRIHTEEKFLDTMFSSYGLVSMAEIENHYRLILAKKLYAADKLEEEIPQLKELCENIFSIKKVDMDLLTNLKNYREFHKQSFQKVIDSVHIDERTDLKEFDFYFDETVNVADWVLNNLR